MEKKLTIIIPFRNENIQVYKTVRNLNRHCNPENFDIICLNDCSDDGIDYSEKLAEFSNVRYLLNEERLGVAGARDKGVAMAETDYILLLDGHMRVFSDVLTPLLEHLDNSNNTLFCLQTRVMKKEDGNIYIDRRTPLGRGARICFDLEKPFHFLNPEWEYLRSQDFLSDTIDIPCVLGAAYATRRDYYLQLHGLNGLSQYGSDETLLSMKVWMSGGRCVLLRELEIAHLYRKKSPCGINRRAVYYNRMVCAELFLPEEIRQKYYKSLQIRPFFSDLWTLMETIRPEIEREREYLHNLFKKSFNDILNLNMKDYEHRIYPQ